MKLKLILMNNYNIITVKIEIYFLKPMEFYFYRSQKNLHALSFA